MNTKLSEKDELCECGHPKKVHSFDKYQCYASVIRKERKRNHLGKYVIVRCNYQCMCREFKTKGETE